MKYALLVFSSPTHNGAHSALAFARAALAQGHQVARVFFYGDGVFNASLLQHPPQDETAIHGHWQALASAHGIDLVVCIAAGLRRGIVDSQEADRYQLPAHNIAEGFQLSGLGQLVEAGVTVDRLITFG